MKNLSKKKRTETNEVSKGKHLLSWWMLSSYRNREKEKSPREELLEQKNGYGYKVSKKLRERIDDQLEIHE